MHPSSFKRLVGLAALLTLAACRHEQPNPCAGVTLAPLTFQMQEKSGNATPDTTYNNQVITFSAPGAPYTSYEWRIGPVDQRTGQKVALQFPLNVLGKIRVRLVARRPPSTACFPGDTGVDTLTRTLTLVPMRDPLDYVRDPRAPIYGRFRGALRNHPADTFTVRIYQGQNFYHPNDPSASPTDYVANLPKGCTAPYTNNFVGWYGVDFDGGGCTGAGGKGYVFKRDSIRLAFPGYYAKPGDADLVFLGKRVR